MVKNEFLESLSWIVNMANDWLVHHSPPDLLNKRQQLLHKKEEAIAQSMVDDSRQQEGVNV